MADTVVVVKRRIPNIWVGKKCCKDCPLFPHSPVTREEHKNLIKDLIEQNRFLECIDVTLARCRGMNPPDDNCCFGVYYMHHDDIEILKSAEEDGRVHFFDIEDLPTLKSSGFNLIRDAEGKCWY